MHAANEPRGVREILRVGHEPEPHAIEAAAPWDTARGGG